MSLLQKFSLVKCFVFDMDGVLTDGALEINSGDNWTRQMNIKDGYALQLAVKRGFRVAVISGSNSPAVVERLNKLGIPDVFMSVSNKKEKLEHFVSSIGLNPGAVLFMGDDFPDMECVKLAGVGACPADAAVDIKRAAHYISPRSGGHGCVRDVIEKVLRLNDKWLPDISVSSV